MAQEIVSTIEVEDAPERVWEVLTAFGDWPAWHPSIEQFQGVAARGERLRFRARSPEGGGAVTVRPTVLDAQPSRILRWRGHFLVRGLFDGTHEFALEPTAHGTRVTQRESFSGLLVPLLKSVVARTARDNALADRALKARVEGTGTGG